MTFDSLQIFTKYCFFFNLVFLPLGIVIIRALHLSLTKKISDFSMIVVKCLLTKEYKLAIFRQY